MANETFPTVEDVLTSALNESLGTANRQPSALQDAALIRQLDVINRTFVNAPYRQEPGQGWEWMEEQHLFNIYSGTTLNGALTTASTSVILTDATNFGTSGRLWTKTTNNAFDYIDWTNKSTNTLTGATDIDISHSTAQKVEMLYGLPSNFAKARWLYLNNSRKLKYIKSIVPPVGGFTTRGNYLLLPEDTGSAHGTLFYYRSPTDLYSGSDASSVSTDKAKSMDIPEDFMRYPVEMLKAHIYQVSGEDERVAPCLQLGQQALDDALSYGVSLSTDLSLRTNY